ncbi:plasmid mobilization protein [Pseudaquidulcibacter saccharophilus]|uniref:plasmid mobilization protein n=1 Tax=Pseudaquidulcibacter saccharophilus TaxID=2831900 RepID=UPI001EFF4953|nr:conjugal transfer protein TraJ [Pseudaquidulcibacter saccharophilus]
MKSGTVNREKSLRVYLSDEDRKIIERRADECNLSVSAYLRKSGLGQRTRSALDGAVAMDLLKINGELGRLGGFLKLLISEKNNVEVSDIHSLLEKIDNTMDEIRRKAGSV